MASILTPINAQLPAQAFGQSASAIGAYEQLRGIREKRELEAQARQRQALVSQLTGRALSGDQGAAQQLTMVAPDAALELQKRQMELLKSRADIANTQAQAQLRQAELPQVQQKTEDVQRQAALRQSQVLKSAVQRIRENPQQYEQIASALVSRGLVPEGSLPDGQPTPEQLSEFEASVDFSQELLQNPVKQEQLNGQLGLIDAGYGLNTPKGKEAAQRLLEADIAVKQSRARQEREDSTVNLPTGVSLINPSRSATREEAKETRKMLQGSVPLVSSVRALRNIVNKVGFQWGPTTDAFRAQGLAAMVQLQLKEALELGALDADAILYMQRLLPDDPTKLRQDQVRAAVETIESRVTSMMREKARINGFDVNVNDILSSNSSIVPRTSEGGIALDTAQRTALLESLRAQGMSPENAARTMDSILRGEAPAVISSRGIMPGRPATDQQASGAATPQRQPTTAAPTQDERSEAARLLDAGLSIDEVRRRLQRRRGARSGNRVELPADPNAARQQMKQMRPVEAARAALNNPQSLTPEQRTEVIRKGIEGKGWLDAAAEVLGLGNGQ